MFTRGGQKELTYAFIYGAGDTKLGTLYIVNWRAAFAKGLTKDKPARLGAAQSLGETIRRKLMARVPGLALLLKGIRSKRKQGWFRGLDGRILCLKSEHSALNDLLQSDGAIIMKVALLILYAELTKLGLVHGQDYAFMLNVHDEWQIECDPRHAETIGEAGRRAIREAGWKLRVRVPLDGEYKVGTTWAETH
jgi:DNA polymerase-1